MTVNIIKLCVGADSIEELADWQKKRYAKEKYAMHITRQTPKRAEKVLDGGSLYWVINGFISVRQKIMDLREVDKNGIPSCGIMLDKKLVRVEPRPRKAFQGWRYFEVGDVPKDLDTKNMDMDDKLLRKLAELGLVQLIQQQATPGL